MSEEEHKLMQRIRYRHVKKIYTDLKEVGTLSLIYDFTILLGYHDNDPLKVTDLIRLDQWHHLGTEPVDAAIKLLGISK
ncbi:Hypp8149 [Branchiostoma lanceolatum]|uniref:Hypp8149 protein n=1 Tax=Branchiostoma lanceolatum TaxID=7740 RepID=A0A8J9Z7D7_BRALA|nr:Hypp8149 [Branchiostoma lanceolatum]